MKNWHNPELIKSFGAYFKKLRKELNLTQKNIAVKAEIEQSHVSEIEAGLRNLTLDIILSLAQAMDIEPQRFFDFLHSAPYNISPVQQDKIQFPEMEMHLQLIGEGFPENETYLQLIRDEFPEMEMLLQ